MFLVKKNHQQLKKLFLLAELIRLLQVRTKKNDFCEKTFCEALYVYPTKNLFDVLRKMGTGLIFHSKWAVYLQNRGFGKVRRFSKKIKEYR